MSTANGASPISRRSRRSHSPAFKAKIVLAAIRGDATLPELTQRFDVLPNQSSHWREQFLAGAATVFAEGRTFAAPVDV